MAEKSEIAGYVIAVLARKTGLGADEIRPGARLLHDLGLDGDDAAEAIDEISRHFSIDISHFDFSQYFRSEPSLASLFKRDAVDDKRPLTVADLIEAAHRQILAVSEDDG